jgi:hypothetical protein
MSKSPTTTKREKKLPPIHPGKILAEDMRDEEISINGLAPGDPRAGEPHQPDRE